ncbi:MULTISPECIES: ABC transporter substrate-binding protein [unclassified Neorhizobium]|uniref:ABC transporter substrate-binding protein n=1 Tax=unclassified Neorhizobium TaxID=2629175 RepID=UPI001FF5E883|nr:MULTISPECIES: sugar ABC transporter substrate-binding protein [unclassified Neorhizobium]MCJ9672218.1 sugar ABC transporter substrate-binding protein [Neorhizobium sp. SHOUNA12B]MCJ9748047.1 sugar ABC transporter substrate-binding protein [Neorhizobium sp. SHOUNA12A]
MVTTNRRNLVLGAAVMTLASLSGVNFAWSAGTANLSLMIWDPAQKAGVQKAVDAFQSANPNIKVDLVQVPPDQYYTKLDASLGAGEGPDVMWQSSRASYYVNGGALEPLTDYIKKDNLSLDTYNKQIADLYNFGGRQYGVPKDMDAWTFVYNAATFKKLGVEAPKTDWTWDDMVRIAKEIKAKQSATDVPLYYNFSFNNGVASLVHALGGKVIDNNKGMISSAAGTKALEMVKGLQDDRLILNVADSSDFNPVSSLISGKLAMGEIPSWNLSLLSKADLPNGTFQVVRMPSVNGSWTTDTNGLVYVMNVNSKHKDESWKLIQFLTSEQGAVLHAEGGAGLPANKSKAALGAFVKANEKLGGLEQALSVTIDKSYLRTTTQFPKVIPANMKITSTLMGPFYAGTASTADTAKKIDDVLNEALR